jgi:hypothetical protein
MEEPGEDEGAIGSTGYANFVVRVARGSPSSGAADGLVQRYRTGEKRAFTTASARTRH